ncbi:hypothetical protein IL314_13065 [Enterococcus faecium]|nr:hypothetical protein [Enterococcus faecium]MBK5039040.1 hypothetical protein [Enterococcus faecium]MBK5044114.1 hypothetical protein [Enterococcus faecium]MBK5068901.1 hypothetical protein [Enterococcus faecium]MBK5132274.1 hypothetical protein [Enterococcus faecium]
MSNNAIEISPNNQNINQNDENCIILDNLKWRTQKVDRVYITKNPLKLSVLLNITSKLLVEKYETDTTRDELLRKSLDNYIRKNLTQEDKQDLFCDVIKELELFRKKNPILPEVSKDGTIIQTVDQIKKNTEESIRKSWGLKSWKK